jgi:hypothetical protein
MTVTRGASGGGAGGADSQPDADKNNSADSKQNNGMSGDRNMLMA